MAEWINIDASYQAPAREYGVCVDDGGWTLLIERYQDGSSDPFEQRNLLVEYEVCPLSLTREEGKQRILAYCRDFITPQVQDLDRYEIDVCAEFADDDHSF